MKNSTRVQPKKTPKNVTTGGVAVKSISKKTTSPSTSRVVRKKISPISKIARTTKRYGKKTLREVLLSRTLHVSFKIVVGLMVSGSALYGAYALIGNTFGNDVIVSKAEILSRVSKHVQLPETNPDAVVRVQDASVLKKQNDFYANVKEGDYVVMYTDIALIYDLRNDSIVALKRTDRR